MVDDTHIIIKKLENGGIISYIGIGEGSNFIPIRAIISENNDYTITSDENSILINI